jgi:putative membrane protein
MTSIAQTIEINILQMMGEKDVPAKEDKGLYYEM